MNLGFGIQLSRYIDFLSKGKYVLAVRIFRGAKAAEQSEPREPF